MARLNTVRSFRGTTKTADGNLTCGACSAKIEPGDGYRWWANRAPGQRGSFRNIRCMKPECMPSLAERTPGRRGQLLGMQEGWEKALAAAKSIEDLDAVRDDIANELREFGQEYQESAENMESGFGHETEQSATLREVGEALEALADDIEGIEGEDPEDAEEEFDEEKVGAELSQELFGIDDPAALDEDQEMEWTDALQEKRNEFDTENAERESDNESQVEDYREQISEKMYEAETS